MASRKSQNKGPALLRKQPQKPVFPVVKWGPTNKGDVKEIPTLSEEPIEMDNNIFRETIAPVFKQKAPNSWIRANYEILLNMRNIIYSSLESVNNSDYITTQEFFTSFCNFIYTNGCKIPSSFNEELSPELEEEVILYLNACEE
jgi:hypothetical protein